VTLAIALLLAVATTDPGLAQRTSRKNPFPKNQFPGEFPFSDPSKMMKRFFGKDDVVDQERLRSVQISLSEEQRAGGGGQRSRTIWPGCAAIV
jgi:hypothetical protein